MAGLLALTVFGAYIFISALLVYKTAKFAQKTGYNSWVLGAVIALIMYLLVFWDFIPVIVNHHNLCKKYGTFKIIKSPEDWFKENPDVIGKKWAAPGNFLKYENLGSVSREWLSDYIYSESYFEKNYAHAISKYEYKLIDARTGQLLAHMIDFERGGGNPFLRSESITDYKMWLSIGDNSCGKKRRDEFNKQVLKFSIIARKGYSEFDYLQRYTN